MFNTKATERLCSEYGVELLRLPPYQCDLNVIELLWGYLKNHLRDVAKSKTKINEIIQRGYGILEGIDANSIKNMFDHVEKLENWYKTNAGMDIATTNVVQPFIINLEEDLSDSESDYTTEMSGNETDLEDLNLSDSEFEFD